MNAPLKGTALVFAAAGAALVKKALDRPPGGWPASGPVDSQRWRVVTVNRPIDADNDKLPQPLADLGDAIEVQISPAPGDKGTQLAVRLRSAPDESRTEPSVEALREALRDAKQLLEVGWILEPDRNRTSRPTPLNAPLRWATSAARGLGRL